MKVYIIIVKLNCGGDIIFNNKHFITCGVEQTIPPILQVIMWELINQMPVDKDYLQVFVLSESGGKQKLVHTQENPQYSKEYVIQTKPIVFGKIFVIDDETHSTMLMNYEY